MGKNDEKTVKDFALQISSDKLTMDKLNRAYYGLTFDELIKAAITGKEDEHDAQGKAAENDHLDH